MNIRLQKYKKNRIAGMNIYNAARAAGYSHNYANKGGKRIETLGKVGMMAAFECAGLTDKAIIAHALEGLKAMKPISCNIYLKANDNSVIDMKDANSMTKDFVDVEDWNARHKYFETILKLTDRLKEKAAVEINTYTQIWNRTADKTKDVDAQGRVHIRNQKEMPS